MSEPFTKALPARILWAAACAVATALSALPARAEFQPRVSTLKDFRYQELHASGEAAQAAQRGYKIEDAEEGSTNKVLSTALNKMLVRKGDFAVLATPGIGPLEEGTYRATVRMKVQGMMNSLGSAVGISAGGQTREVWMNEFAAEDAYQEFTLDFESRPGDLVTRRDVMSWGAPGGPGTVVPRSALPAIRESLERNGAPWADRFAWWMAERVVVPGMKGKPEDIPSCAGMVKALVEKNPGREILIDPATTNAALTADVIRQINAYGRVQPDGSVSLYFPKNTSGQGTGGTRGPATPLPTLRNVLVESVRVEKLPEPDQIVVREVRARYPWRRPGESQSFRIWMHNRSGKPQTGTLRLVLQSGLDREDTLWEQEVTLPHGGYEHLSWTWAIPAGQRLWGQAVVARLLKGGQVVSEERTWFAIHPRSNAVMIHDAGNDDRFRHPYASGSPRTQNHKELFGATCTIYDSAGVVPDADVFDEPYAVGNGTYLISMPTLASITLGLVSEGLAPFFYLESSGSAKRAFEIFWDHPDWVSEMPANMDIFLLQRDKDIQTGLAYLRGELKTNKPPDIARAGGAYSGQLVDMNGVVKENVDRVIDGTVRMCEATSFAGVRWDGLPFRAKNAKSLGGTWGKTPEELDAISVANLQRFKQTVRAKSPNFEVRANGGVAELEQRQEDPCDFDKAFAILQKDPLHLELVRDHGSIMEEMWMAYGSYGTYANSCLNYLRACHFENAAFKMAGGHNGHMLWFYDGKSQYTPDEIYQQLFTVLGGAHLDGAFGPIVESLHEFGVYAARFSEFFWDPELRPIRAMVDKVEVDAKADLWCAETGFEKVNESGRLIYVIPVINPPVTELWLQNRFGLLPEPIREPVPVTVQIPEGWSGVHAVWLLDNAPHPEVRKLEFDEGRGEVTFELPELVIFKVAVVEFRK